MRFSYLRRSSLVAGLCAAALLSATACSGGKPVTVGGGSGGHPGGTLVAAINLEPDALDPNAGSSYFAFEVMQNVFDTLIEHDDKANPAPGLVSSWSTSADGLRWTLALRTTKWQDGEPFTSADVVYTLQRLMKGKFVASQQLSGVKSVAADGPQTVVLKLKKPAPNLLTVLSSPATAIVQRKNVESGAIKTKPVGTGPFKMASWAHGSAINLVANPDYWAGKPKLAGLKFVFIADQTVALQNLRSGQIHWTDNLPTQQVASLMKSNGNGFTVQTTPSYGDFNYLMVNAAHRPFNDPRVRQAIAYAIDRDAIEKATQFGMAVVNQTAIPKVNSWYYDYAPYTHDLAKAKSLLAEAGVKNLKLEFAATSAGKYTVIAAQLVAAELAPLGITVKIRTLEGNAFLTEMTSGHFDMGYNGFASPLDPSDFYYRQMHTGGLYNWQKYSNPAVDKLLDKADVTMDRAQRKALYDQVAKLVVDDVGAIYLGNNVLANGVSTKVHGYQVRPDRRVQFFHASLS